MSEKDLYAALGVARDADADTIKKAYRRLARKWHPDVNPNDPNAEERFKEISFANDVLSDEEKRKHYDEFGMASLEPGFDPEQARTYARWSQGARQSPFHETFTSETDLEDLLSGFFGGGGARRGPRPGRDAHSEIRVDFLDAVRGGEVSLSVPGRGKLRVRIPPGSDSGTRIRLAGQGERGREAGPPGDLYLTLRVKPHPFFTREGDDLAVDVPVTLPELVLGASIEIPTLEGTARINVPPGSPNGRRLRLRGRGAPRRGDADPGDLYARLVLELPTGDDARLKELAEKMEPLYGDRDVRAKLKGST